MVRTVVDSARSGTALVRAWPGLAGQDLTSGLAEGLRLDRPGGVIVSDIYDGGPADRAGIAAGDVVVTVDGDPKSVVSGKRGSVRVDLGCRPLLKEKKKKTT